MKFYEQIELVQTCSACPEQYDAFIGKEKIGYLRLRHGCFTVEYHGCIVYTAKPIGDGIFEDEERERYLTDARKALSKSYMNDKFIKIKDECTGVSIKVLKHNPWNNE